MPAISLTLVTPSRESTKLSVVLSPFDGRPNQAEIAKVLFEKHCADPELVDCSWEFPTIESSSSSDFIGKKFKVTRSSEARRDEERREFIRQQRDDRAVMETHMQNLMQKVEELEKSAKAQVKQDIKKLEKDIDNRAFILWFESLGLVLQGMNDIIMDTNRPPDDSARYLLTKNEKKVLKKHKLHYITKILAASTSVNFGQKTLALKALRCLTPEEISLATACHTALLTLRNPRNSQQHPRPSKDYSLGLFRERFNPEHVRTLELCIDTLRRLPSDTEDPQSNDLFLFGERDTYTEGLEERLRDLKERRAMMGGDSGGQEAISQSKPLKRDRDEADISEEVDDNGWQPTKKLKASAEP